MTNIDLMQVMPLWMIFALTVALVIGLIEVGFRLGVGRGKRGAGEGGAAPIASVTASTLGLLAFLLAFTFGMAATRFETRRQLLLDEVNAIGTCYLRAGMTPEPHRHEIRKRLREYVDLRANIYKDPKSLDATLKRCDQLQNEIWAHAEELTKPNPANEMFALFVISLNEVIDFHTKRVVVMEYRIPMVIWLALYAVAALSMAAVGYQFGCVGKRDLAISFVLALAFSVVIYLIADLDSIDRGTLRVSQQPMIELDEKLDSSAAQSP